MHKKFILIVVFFLSACTNPFSTRTPEEPAINTKPHSINSLQNHPDSLFSKLKYAFKEKNVNYYIECLADPARVKTVFTFMPQQNEAYRLTDWTLQDEFNYFSRLVNNKDIQKVNLQIYNVEDWTFVSNTQDTMQSRFSYEITLYLKTKKEYYRGQSIFKILRSFQSLWYIYLWEDFQLNSKQVDSTWSTLKANYR